MVIDARGPSIGPSAAEILASHAGGTGSPTKTAVRVADAIAARGDDGTWLSTVPRDQLLAAAEEIEKCPGKDIAAVWHAVRYQRQHRCRGGADHTLLPRLRLRCVDDGPGGAAPARRGRVVRRQDESGPVRHRTQRHPHALHHPAQCVRRRDAFGSPFPPAVYIGQPGWKDAGGRANYSLTSGVIIGIRCFLGLFGVLDARSGPAGSSTTP